MQEITSLFRKIMLKNNIVIKFKKLLFEYIYVRKIEYLEQLEHLY